MSADLFYYDGCTRLALFDGHSYFLEVEKLVNTSVCSVIDILSAIFARYRIPVDVCTDGGAKFLCHKFAAFVSRYNFKHITS